MEKPIFIFIMLIMFLACNSELKPVDVVEDFKINQNDSIKGTEENYSYDNEVINLGIGLIIVADTFELFEDSVLSKSYGSYDVYESDFNFYTKFYKPDYGILHFVCLKKTNIFYQVLVNYSDTLYVENNSDNTFSNWSNYITQSYGIRRKTSAINKKLQFLHENSNELADTLSVPGGIEMFCAIKVENDWVKVQYDCFFNDENNPFEGEPCATYINECNSPLTGWLKWKEDNVLSIDISLMP